MAGLGHEPRPPTTAGARKPATRPRWPATIACQPGKSRPENSRRIASRLGADPLLDRVLAAPLVKREHGEPRAHRPCNKPAGAGAIVAMQPIHPKEQDVGLRRLRDALRLPAERGFQFGFECLAVRAGRVST